MTFRLAHPGSRTSLTRRHILLAALLAVVGCGTSGADPGASAVPRSSDLITEADLAEFHHYTVLDVIRQIRPRWLRARGPSLRIQGESLSVERGTERVQTYVDELQGSLEALEAMPVDNVLRIRYLTASEATMRFGIDHEGGAIMVTTRAR